MYFIILYRLLVCLLLLLTRCPHSTNAAMETVNECEKSINMGKSCFNGNSRSYSTSITNLGVSSFIWIYGEPCECSEWWFFFQFPHVLSFFNCFSMYFFFSYKTNRWLAGIFVFLGKYFELHGKSLTAARWFIGIAFKSHFVKWIYKTFMLNLLKMLDFAFVYPCSELFCFSCYFWAHISQLSIYVCFCASVRVTTTEAKMLTTVSIFNAAYAKYIYLYCFFFGLLSQITVDSL